MLEAAVPADTGEPPTGVYLVERLHFALCKPLLVLAIIFGDQEDSESHPGRASCYWVGTKAIASLCSRSYRPCLMGVRCAHAMELVHTAAKSKTRSA